MKILEKQFICNADLCGDHTFTQVRKDNGVAIYQRTNGDGKLVGYEVFVVKTRKKGDKLPGGNVEKEDRECYPGAAAFGKTAWFVMSLDRAQEHFDRLVDKLGNAQTKTKKQVVETVIFPKNRDFTVKMMVTELKVPRRYIRRAIKQMLVTKELIEVGKIKSESGKGQPSVVYRLT